MFAVYVKQSRIESALVRCLRRCNLSLTLAVTYQYMS